MWHNHGMPRRDPASLKPLDAAALERLALRYVERFATTRGKLTHYLRRKVRERGWLGGVLPDPAALADRMAALGYIDDRGYAATKAGAMARRGLGARRVIAALHAAGVGEDDRPAINDAAPAAALAFARRKRLGPFAAAVPDRDARTRQLAQFLRAGHRVELAKRLLAMRPGDEIGEDWAA